VSEIGENEFAARQADIAAVKAGAMALELAQKRARKRQRQSGLTRSEFYRELMQATGRSRVNAAVSTPGDGK
jgi:hypothetical protein